MFVKSSVIALAGFIASAYGHARLQEPAGFGRLQGLDGFADRSPLNTLAQPAFCRGLQNGGGEPSVSWAAGSQQTFSLELDMAAHNGGSMQAALSFDDGKTFKVIKSFIEGFPRNLGGNTPDPNQVYQIVIPANAKAGRAIFSWTWSNHTGNREWYQDCAPITITGTGTSTLDALPDIYVANLGSINDCTNAEGSAVEYPNPGEDVVRGTGPGGSAPPTGNCGPVSAPKDAPGSAPKDAPGSAPKDAPGPAPNTPKSDNAAPADKIGKGATYNVQPGDTCSVIAAQSGVSVADIIAKNPSVNADCTNLQPGQALTLRRRSRIMRDIA